MHVKIRQASFTVRISDLSYVPEEAGPRTVQPFWTSREIKVDACTGQARFMEDSQRIARALQDRPRIMGQEPPPLTLSRVAIRRRACGRAPSGNLQ